ncbi:unnamed protein product [Rangifer tarandus platyrhynchus]|uniref:Uncharacterized protein n=1 Tax=Rangifer tarandus platyrhynchus TaxID=3082113 RepID=A0AC59ZLM6_RANTA
MEKVDSKALRSMEVVSRSHETSSLEHSTGQLSSHPAIVCQLKMQTSEESEWLPSVLCSPGPSQSHPSDHGASRLQGESGASEVSAGEEVMRHPRVAWPRRPSAPGLRAGRLRLRRRHSCARARLARHRGAARPGHAAPARRWLGNAWGSGRAADPGRGGGGVFCLTGGSRLLSARPPPHSGHSGLARPRGFYFCRRGRGPRALDPEPRTQTGEDVENRETKVWWTQHVNAGAVA